MKVLIVGYGAVGEVLTKLLVSRDSIEKIFCIDYVDKKVVSNSKVSFQRFDITDKVRFQEFLEQNKFNLVVNTAVPKFNVMIMDACYETKTNYMDLASMWDPDPSGKPWSPPNIKTNVKSPYKVEEFDYYERFKQREISGLIVAGVTPGLSNLFSKEASEQLDSVDEIKIRLIDISGTDDLYFAWSKEGLLDEVGCNPLVYENGNFISLEPFSGEEIYDYPKPFGKKKSTLICQDEIGTLPFFLKTKRISIKDYDNLVDYHKVLYQLGYLSRKEVDIKGIKLSPFDFSVKILPDVPKSLTEKRFDNAQFAFVVEAIGKKKGKKLAVKYYIEFPPQKKINNLGLNANFISYPTALSASLFVLAMKNIQQTGVFPPECLDDDIRSFIIKELSKVIKVSKKIYVPKKT